MTEVDILNSLNVATGELKKTIQTQLDEIVNKTNGCLNALNLLSSGTELWKESSYKFSSTSKHQDIKLVSDILVKATNSSGYKFALM